MLRKFISAVLIASMVLGVAACDGLDRRTENTGTQVVDLLDNDSLMERYMEAVQDYDRVEYEQVYIDFGERSIGPTEYRFRGIVYLTEDEAERLWDAYEWEEKDDVEFEFVKLDISDIGEGPWYSCNQFNSNNYSTIVPYYTVFDGEKLVFDIHQI